MGFDYRRINFGRILFRKKEYDDLTIAETDLNRVLGLIDVSCIGIAFTLAGVYILGGEVITKYAGPGLVLSFLIAGFATMLSALCYAELGARYSRAGSAYVYIYVTIGEIVGFIMGWDLILEYVIGAASIASSLSQNIDALTGFKIKTYLSQHVPMNANGLAPYPDFLAFCIVVATSLILIIGIKESTFVNKIVTILNFLIIIVIIIFGAIKFDSKNWKLQITPNITWTDSSGNNMTCGNNSTICGSGGFLPFGFQGVLAAAAKCFYAYIGFDAIACAGEEVINPKKIIPLGIMLTLIVCTIAYFGTSIVITGMIPYYMVDLYTPYPLAFDYVGWYWAKYFISVGCILTIAACLYGGLYPMTRIVYSLASDGLIFQVFAKVLPKFKTPVFSILITGVFSGIMTLLFDLNQLIDMMSIGTLMAYTIVALCVMVLRYRPIKKIDISNEQDENLSEIELSLVETIKLYLKNLVFPSKECNNVTSLTVNFLLLFAVIDIIIISAILNFIGDLNNVFVFVFIPILAVICVIISILVWRQPQNQTIDTFKIPFVPFSTLLSIFINIYLMLTLSGFTWLRFVIWFIIGEVIYFSYGIFHSKENKNDQRCEMKLFKCNKEKSYEINTSPSTNIITSNPFQRHSTNTANPDDEIYSVD